MLTSLTCYEWARGKFNRGWLFNKWNQAGYNFPEKNYLLNLMKKDHFELCYQLYGTDDEYILPQLLPSEKPNYKWNEHQNLQLRFEYPFMPKGIITHLIVRLYTYLDRDENDQDFAWSRGAIFVKQDLDITKNENNCNLTRAEVIEDISKKGLPSINIKVSGNLGKKKELLTIIREQILRIHDRFGNLNYDEMIPCNCQSCKYSLDPNFYEFNKLRERMVNRKETIECDNPPYETVKVLDLIDDVIIEHNNLSLQRQVNIHINQGDERTTNQSRNLNISGNAQVTASGAGALSQGDNQGTIANKINQNNSQQTKESKLIKILGIVAALATIIALFFNGIFNTEVRQWFDNLFEGDIPSTSEPEQN